MLVIFPFIEQFDWLPSIFKTYHFSKDKEYWVLRTKMQMPKKFSDLASKVTTVFLETGHEECFGAKIYQEVSWPRRKQFILFYLDFSWKRQSDYLNGRWKWYVRRWKRKRQGTVPNRCGLYCVFVVRNGVFCVVISLLYVFFIDNTSLLPQF